MIYLLILIGLLLASFLYDFGNLKIGRNFVFYVFLIVLICLSGFRYRVGGDTYFYILRHTYIPTLSEIGGFEFGVTKLQPLWILLSACAKSITEDFYMVQIFHAIIVNSVIFGFIKTNTKYSFTGILFYYTCYYPYFNFEILRESLAISIFLLSINFLLRKKWIVYYFLCVVAFLFHFSGVILFFIPIMVQVKFRIILPIIIFLIGLGFNTIFSGLVNSINVVSGLIASMQQYSEYTPTLFGILSIMLFYISYPMFIYITSNKKLKINSRLYPLLNSYILIGAFTSFFFIFFRFLNYLTPVLLLFVTEIVHAVFKRKEFKLYRVFMAYFVVIVFSSMHVNRYFSDTSKYVANTKWYSHWYPYYSIFDKKVDSKREQLIHSENDL